MYRFSLPLEDDMAVFVQVGIGMDIGLGRYVSVEDNDSNGYDYGYEYDYFYGYGYGYDYDNDNDKKEINMGYGKGNPKCVQFSVPVGFGFIYNHFEISARYSFGLTNNASNYFEAGNNLGFKQRMWQAGISILF